MNMMVYYFRCRNFKALAIHPFRLAKWGFQRFRRGFSNDDVYDIKSFAFDQLARMLRQMQKTTISYPAFMTPEQWDEELLYGAQLLENLAHQSEFNLDDDFDMSDYFYSYQKQEAFAWLQKWYDHLWI